MSASEVSEIQAFVREKGRDAVGSSRHQTVVEVLVIYIKSSWLKHVEPP